MRVVVIAGVGLIGGSFALALRKAGFDGRIVGVGSERTIQEALALGVIDQGAPLHEAAPRADLLILSHTISRILETIPILDELVKPGCLITDAGSTKGAIVDCARKHVRRAQFLGGHPMAGSEARGVGAASADLFRGRTWVLTPGNAEELATPAANGFRHWLSAIGAVEMVLAPDEHDRVVALTSHLPQLASTALAETVAAGLASDDQLRAGGPGLADMTRLALSSYEVWKDILDTNTVAVARALDIYLASLAEVRRRLDPPQLEDDFRRAAAFRAKLASR